jgi:hypothetical protein
MCPAVILMARNSVGITGGVNLGEQLVLQIAAFLMISYYLMGGCYLADYLYLFFYFFTNTYLGTRVHVKFYHYSGWACDNTICFF